LGWLVALLCFTCLILGLRLFLIQREIKGLAKKIDETTRHARYGARLYLDENNKTLVLIAESINRAVCEYEERLQRAENIEQNVRLTISAISHDLRTPLTSLKGYHQLLMKADSPEKREEYIKITDGNIRFMTDLVENFYDLSRLEMGDSIFNCEPTNLERTVCERFLGFYDELSEKGIDVVMYGADFETIVSADVPTMDRVLNNLIQNLLRYAKSMVEIKYTDCNDCVLLAISNDTDSPLPKETERIFERFYTSNHSRSNKNAGLGLYITRKLVEGMGGTISAHVEMDRLCVVLRVSKCSA